MTCNDSANQSAEGKLLSLCSAGDVTSWSHITPHFSEVLGRGEKLCMHCFGY